MNNNEVDTNTYETVSENGNDVLIITDVRGGIKSIVMAQADKDIMKLMAIKNRSMENFDNQIAKQQFYKDKFAEVEANK